MPQPAIKNWQNFPPAGGWGVTYELQGQSFTFNFRPSKIVDEIRKVQEANGIYQGDESIWRWLNAQWCEKDPKRCIRSMLTSGPVRLHAPAKVSGGGCKGCGGGTVR